LIAKSQNIFVALMFQLSDSGLLNAACFITFTQKMGGHGEANASQLTKIHGRMITCGEGACSRSAAQQS